MPRAAAYVLAGSPDPFATTAHSGITPRRAAAALTVPTTTVRICGHARSPRRIALAPSRASLVLLLGRDTLDYASGYGLSPSEPYRSTHRAQRRMC